MTRLTLILPALVALLVSGPVWGKELSGACVATSLTYGFPGEEGSKTIGSTDKYRFEAGSVFHSWEGRKEYKYGPISQTVYPNHYTSGLLRFVFTNDQDGYVVHTDNNGWKVINLTCAISR